ncbi:DciA family protein [Bisgaard Taxon 10/6]|uniref:DciA family protein n=1 Tax=Exercitatus varius TaxID=67857 RepID=UPI00294ACC9C|nr:DciA family protein [Exercitatus varius]MDG2955747.1 DciA family protein [Exercitatus varius]MDG2961484.1 DciA family protein [Exercitatus varius]MDG2964027.1 DciA family protein [Exercitatus varius]
MERSKRHQKVMNIKELLDTSSLAQVMKKGLFINELNQNIQQLLPSRFIELYRVANFSEDGLTIEVASAVVRQGFLFRQQELLQTFRRIHPEINRLQFRINPELGKKSIKK